MIELDLFGRMVLVVAALCIWLFTDTQDRWRDLAKTLLAVALVVLAAVGRVPW